MDSLSGLAKKATSDEPAPNNKETSSNYDVVATAKEVTGKVAGATADLIGAASDFGKLDETKGVGKYVDQAETYVRQYDTSKTTADAPTPAAEGGAGDYIKKAGEYLSKPFGGDGGEKTAAAPSQSEGGFGDLTKKAGDLFK